MKFSQEPSRALPTMANLQHKSNATTPAVNTSLDSPIDIRSNFVSDEIRQINDFVTFVFLNGAISTLGMAANVITIVVYVRIGVNDTINISFIALAVSDFFCLLTLFWSSISLNPLMVYNSEKLPFRYLDLHYLFGSWPHVGFTKITGLLTALVTVERCFCVTLPLKVKQIFTPRRTLVIIVIIYMLIFVRMVPAMYANQLVWQFYADTNKTMLGIAYTEQRLEIENYTLGFVSIGMSYTCFITITTFTLILTITLKRKTEWRKSTATSGGTGNDSAMSNRDKKVSKTVIWISTLFIVCYLPVTFGAGAMIIEAEFNIDGLYSDIFLIYWAWVFVLEAVNSSVNIFIYYNMSARFREVFLRLVGRDLEPNKI